MFQAGAKASAFLLEIFDDTSRVRLGKVWTRREDRFFAKSRRRSKKIYKMCR